MYKNHKIKKNAEDAHLGAVVPPNSACPKIGKNLLAISSPSARIAQIA